MSTDPSETPRPLPERPNLRHLKDQARDLLKAGTVASLADALLQVARRYGFPSWPKLKAVVEARLALTAAAQLKLAIDAEDLDRVKALMTAHPELHRAPLGYGKNGPLTWVAECRVPWRPPTSTRLAIATWMIDHGSDVHQGGDGPLMRAALNGDRVAMMDLLVARGADVNAAWGGSFPILFAACEAVDPVALRWLVDHGADPHRPGSGDFAGTALDYLIGAYARSPSLVACIDILVQAGGSTKYDVPVVLDILCGRVDRVRERLELEPALLTRRFPELDFGATGGRRLTLKGATLLHVAAEYLNADAARLLLDSGADVNARATVDEAGVGGQTAIFHAVTQFDNGGLAVAKLLIDRGADLSVRVKVPGHYERPGEIVECTPRGYASRFPEGTPGATIALLAERGAPT